MVSLLRKLAIAGLLISLILGWMALVPPSVQVWGDSPDGSPPTPVQESLPPYTSGDGAPWVESASAVGVEKRFQAVADTEVRQAKPGENFGTSSMAGAGYSNHIGSTVDLDLIRRGLFQFNVTPQFPPGTVIHQATLRLFVAGYCDANATTYHAQRIASDWSEMAATWENQPVYAESYGSTVIPTSFGWVTFDVSDLVRTWLDGTYEENGILIRGPESPPYACAHRAFYTKGGGGYDKAPELIVDYALPAPKLSISQDQFTLDRQCGAPVSTSQTLVLESNLATLSDWTATVSGGDDWLKLSKSSGKVSYIFPEEITLSIDEDAPCPQSGTAQIQIDAPNLGDSPQTITVSGIQQAPNLNVSTNALSFSHRCGVTPPPSKSIEIQSDAAAMVGWTATVSGGDGWLKLSKESGQISQGTPDRIEVSVDETAPCPGTATAEIRIDLPGLGSSPRTTTVSFAQVDRSALVVAPGALTFSHRCGALPPPPQRIEISGGTSTPAAWTATSSDGWLMLSRVSGQVADGAPDQIEISVAETAACPETLTGQITIDAPGLPDSPRSIGVTFEQQVERLFLPAIPNGPSASHRVGAAATSHDRIVLVIGVADYQYLNPPDQFEILRSGEWGEDLIAPRGDVYEVANSFDIGPNGPGLMASQPGHTQMIVLAEESATIANVAHALGWIDEREDAATEVIIYFSGHGGPIPDTSPPIESDGLSELLGVYDTNDTPFFVDHVLDDWFEARLANLETEHLAVILDACNSAGMQVSNANRAILTASREDQNSWESSELEHGVFTYFMLQAMRDAASDDNLDGWLSVQEIYDYAVDPVADYVDTIKKGTKQDLFLDMTRDLKLVPVPVPAMNR